MNSRNEIHLPSRVWVALAAAGTLLTACATTPTTEQIDRDNAQIKAALIAQGDASSLTAAAMLAWSLSSGPPPLTRVPDPDQLALIGKAADLATSDPAIAWTKLKLCAMAPGCDSLADAATFRAVDPSNAAGWMPDLDAAGESRPDDVDAILRSMAKATTFNLYFDRLVTEIADAFERARARTGLTRDQASTPLYRLAWATGLTASQNVPPFQVLAHACTDPSRRATRRDPCDAILKTMAQGDTVLVQSVAASIRIRTEDPGSPARTAAEAWRRNLAWQQEQMASLEIALFRFNDRAAERLRLMASLPKESDVMRSILENHGIAVEPPPGWKPRGSP